MSDFYQNAVNKFKGSPTSVIMFIAALVMFLIGVNHFIEDTYSSYFGLLNLEARYQLNVQIFDWSYWTMSLAPQIASIVFFYLYLANGGGKWLALAAAAQLMDFFADAWYRGNGSLLANGEVFFISSALTFIYFSVGSEMFISVGGGLILKMLAPALSAWKIEMKNIGLASTGQYSGGGGNGGRTKGDEPFVAPKSEYKPQHRPKHAGGHYGDERRAGQQNRPASLQALEAYKQMKEDGELDQ